MEIRLERARSAIGLDAANRRDVGSEASAPDRAIPNRRGVAPDALPAETEDPVLPPPRPRPATEGHRAAPRFVPSPDMLSQATRSGAAGEVAGVAIPGIAAASTIPIASPMTAAMPLAAGPGLAETPAATHQIAGAIAADPGVGQIDLRLDPPELGRVEIRLDFLDDTLRAVVSAERGATADLLRRHGDGLIQQLREAGFAQVDLGFGQFAGDTRDGSDRSADPRHRNTAPDAGRATADARADAKAHRFQGLRSLGFRSDQALDLKV